jgi:hypothetical protein
MQYTFFFLIMTVAGQEPLCFFNYNDHSEVNRLEFQWFSSPFPPPSLLSAVQKRMGDPGDVYRVYYANREKRACGHHSGGL